MILQVILDLLPFNLKMTNPFTVIAEWFHHMGKHVTGQVRNETANTLTAVI